MTTYLVFSGKGRLPVLGWEAWKGEATTPTAVCALLAACTAYGCDWYQVVDTGTWTVMESGRFGAATLPGYTPDIVRAWETFLDQESTA